MFADEKRRRNILPRRPGVTENDGPMLRRTFNNGLAVFAVSCRVDKEIAIDSSFFSRVSLRALR